MNRRVLILLIILAVIVFLGSLYYIWSQSTGKISLLTFKKEKEIQVKFDTSLFESQAFKELKIYGEYPLEIGFKGKANPFIK